MKRPTQQDVAKLAGVSRATVSYVLNGLTENGRVPISVETRNKVKQAIEELGYVPDASAQALRTGNTKNIGLIIPDMNNPHFWEHAAGVEKEVFASGYRLLLSSMEYNIKYGEDIFKDLSHQRVDGLILMGGFINNSEKVKNILTQFQKRRLAIVEMTDKLNIDSKLDRIEADYFDATKEVIAHLISLGHRKIGFLQGIQEPILAEDRLIPYQESLLAVGLEDMTITCGPSLEEGYQAALELLRSPGRPTALIVVNDLLAMGVIRAAADLGLKIPKDLSVVGYDNIQIAKYMVPRLTTVSKDAFKLGREAVKLLLARIEDPTRPRQVIRVSPLVIFRESTGPVPEMV